MKKILNKMAFWELIAAILLIIALVWVENSTIIHKLLITDVILFAAGVLLYYLAGYNKENN